MTAGDKNPILISFRWSSVRSMATPEKVVALQGLKNKFNRERCFGAINFGNKPGFEPTDLAATHHLNIGRLLKKNLASSSSSCKKFEPSQRQWQLTWVTQMWRMWRIKKKDMSQKNLRQIFTSNWAKLFPSWAEKFWQAVVLVVSRLARDCWKPLVRFPTAPRSVINVTVLAVETLFQAGLT